MTDIGWNFRENNIVIEGGDIALVNDASLQNAGLITLKEVASIFNPQIGVGYETYYANVKATETMRLLGVAKKQIQDDGAKVIRLGVSSDNGTFVINIESKY